MILVSLPPLDRRIRKTLLAAGGGLPDKRLLAIDRAAVNPDHIMSWWLLTLRWNFILPVQHNSAAGNPRLKIGWGWQGARKRNLYLIRKPRRPTSGVRHFNRVRDESQRITL